jgi:hypothetical protein
MAKKKRGGKKRAAVRAKRERRDENGDSYNPPYPALSNAIVKVADILKKAVRKNAARKAGRKK